MNVLIINGSPRGEKSNSLRLSKAFAQGALDAAGEGQLKVLDVSSLRIESCRGCFYCWQNPQGKCIIDDQEDEFLASRVWADLTVWSFPLYYAGVPGHLKTAIDRQLSFSSPVKKASQPSLKKKAQVVISTCGYAQVKNSYDGVRALFSHLCEGGSFEAIFCAQGELLRQPLPSFVPDEVAQRIAGYIETVRQAGGQWAKGGITAETHAALNEPLIPLEAYEAMAKAAGGKARASGG